MATAIRTRIAKAEKPTAELTDIEVLEVANVDAPANKRPFIVVKSAEGAEPSAEPVVAADPGAASTPAPTPEAVAAQAAPEQQVPDASAATPVAAASVSHGADSQPVQSEPVAKRGAKMAKERLSRLQDAVVQLTAILKELQDEVEAEGESTDKSKVAKADESNPLAPKLEELTKSVSDLQAKLDDQAKQIVEQSVSIAKQAEVIKAARQMPAPNSSEPEEVSKSAKPFSWPNDMNAQRT
jgi:uncharacterized phage infection (PIP) family protein YhgE